MSEPTLLDRVREGLPYRTVLRRLARNILRNNDEVADVLQEVHVALWLKAEHDLGEPISDLKAWLIRTTRNRALDVQRARKNNDRMLQQMQQEATA